MKDKGPSLDWAGVDPTVPNSARMYVYFLGGKDYFPADVAAARKVQELQPLIKYNSRENRYFLRRAVTYLTNEAGVRQFLDIGAGLPTQGNVHEIAPEARVVYVDNDPKVIVHARALMADHDGGRVRVVQGDARDPEAILDDPQVTGFLDFDQPIGLLMVGLLHFVPDRNGAHEAVEAFRRPLASGSYLVISHGTQEGFDRQMVADVNQVYEQAMPYQMRTREQIARFFAGLDMIEPGLVTVTDWRPDGITTGVAGAGRGVLAGVGRVP
ncbi:SAM-dependent methyltransferase [Nonomuraea basaltis]|uniref:SAM-dependent methyltransferase n=1 Tax=Nonomuraea basaltis TaxID=2495887 RepID=UPI00110C5ACD|nr:SAM-dependent methyltransferase [Nonomuraea basaltis]TMR90524.1 SAM-dependent methyltransferase [Nonomuraea basaltis]